MSYPVNEMFVSPQGEGARQGQQSVFLRMAGCNLRCAIEPGPRSPGGFDCDTEFRSWRPMTTTEIVQEALHLWAEQKPTAPWVVLTGGEPMLTVDHALCDALHAAGFRLQMETNGTRAVPAGFNIDWLTVSPKVAEHAIRQRTAHEVKYVRGYGQALPRTVVQAEHQFISPAFAGQEVDQAALTWCRRLVADSPGWELSIQMHKIRGER